MPHRGIPPPEDPQKRHTEDDKEGSPDQTAESVSAATPAKLYPCQIRHQVGQTFENADAQGTETEEGGRYIDQVSSMHIEPPAVHRDMPLDQLLEEVFLSYNAGRLREVSKLFAEKMLDEKTTLGLSIAGALTPAGMGKSCFVPMIENGFVDYIISTGANMYHDMHFALGQEMRQSRPGLNDQKLRDEEIIRIYDILFPAGNLYDNDQFIRTVCRGEEFQKTMGTPEFYHLLGKHVAAAEEQIGRKGWSVLAAAYRAGLPIFTSSPGDSSIGMNLAALELEGCAIKIDPSLDVNHSAAIVYNAMQEGQSAALILGGGSPKNFLLQTEPQIQEVLGLAGRGHDFFGQLTDARVDTGGLSGATNDEAYTWGKINKEGLFSNVTCYVDSTIGFPLMLQYGMIKRSPRPLRRLMDRTDELMQKLATDYAALRTQRGDARGPTPPPSAS